MIIGGQSRDDRVSGIDQFTRTRGAAAMIVSATAGPEGIDLRTAPNLIWFSLTDSWVMYKQLEDRIALSPVPTSFTYLLAEGTYDEVVYQSLQEDGDVARWITKRPELLRRSTPKL
jgi:hypothetical protein